MPAPIEFPRRRETGEIIQDSGRFIMGERKPLTRLIAMYVLPFILIYATAQIFMQMKVAGSTEMIREMEPEKLLQEVGPIYKNLMITLAFYLFVQSLYMAALFSYVHVYVFKGKGEFDLAMVVPLLSSNALVALGASLAAALIAFSGLFLLIIPGLILANSLSLTPFIAIYERKGISRALQRSFSMTGKAWWQTLVLNLTGILIIWGVNILLTLPVSATMPASGAVTAGNTQPLQFETWQYIYMGASLAISSLCAIFPFLFQALQYFNLAARYPETPSVGQ